MVNSIIEIIKQALTLALGLFNMFKKTPVEKAESKKEQIDEQISKEENGERPKWQK